jgi:hypothetical protein
VSKASVPARLKELKGDTSAEEEVSVLKQCLTLFDQEAEAKKAVKEAQEALDKAVFAQYPKLSEDEIKKLVVDDKWQATLKAAIQAEIERVTQQLANRVKTLEERYAEPLPQLMQDVEALSSKVDEHLKRWSWYGEGRYKQTEVGVIPEDWDDKKLGDFVSLQRGYDLTARERRTGNVPVMGAAGQNGCHDTALVQGPGIVLGRSGASFGQVHYCEKDYWPHNTGLYATDLHGNDPRFAFYFLDALDFSRYNSGGAQQSLNRNFIYPIPIAVPSIRRTTIDRPSSIRCRCPDCRTG